MERQRAPRQLHRYLNRAELPDGLTTVARIVDAVGIAPVMSGPLAEGVRLEPGTEPFGANVGAEELCAMLFRFPESERAKSIRCARAAAAESAEHTA